VVLLALLASVVAPAGLAARQPALAEPLSFEAVYEAQFDFVWRNVRRLGVPDAQVDDAVQEVFLVVHRRLHEFEARSSVKTWIFGIALRVASAERRSIRRKSPHTRAPGGPVEPDTVADEGADQEERAARAEGARTLHRMLSALDDDKRAVFVMAELEEMSAPEIAEAVGANVNTVYARLRAARREFEEAVARERARESWRLA
jgi:RNA polymerase sigma-70 factor (ECF subfamily)